MSALVFALGVVSTFFGGYVASCLWGWFVTPLGVMAITWLHGVGLLLLVRVLFGQSVILSREEAEDTDWLFANQIVWLIGLVFTLIIGKVIS